MWALAVLPAVSHALSFQRGGASHWAEVCTPQGMKLVAVDAALPGQTSAPLQAAGHLEHCPFCTLHGLDLAPPPAPAAALPQAVAVRSEPLLFLQAPRTLFAWRTAQPRGPPTVS